MGTFNCNRLLSLLVTPFVVLLSACTNDEISSISSNSVIYCSEGTPESFNPQTVTSGMTIDATANQLYNRLITFQGPDNTIGPSLAKSWHVTRDGKKITFYLRNDVHFHQTEYFTPTRPLNADDVIFSFNRILYEEHPYHKVSGAQYPFFQSVEFSNLIESIERINEYTVRFSLKRADSSILANLATDFAVILSEEYAQQLIEHDMSDNIDSFPIGTGPFKLKEYRSGSHIRYVPHEKYWMGPSTLQQLIFDITPIDTGRLTKLLTGECDVIAYPIEHEKIIQHPDLKLDEVTSFNVGYLGFNTLRAPFDNKLVRRAVAHAINKQAILDVIYAGTAEEATTIIPNTSWAFDPSIRTPEFSPDKAKALLAEAGYTEGFEIELWAMPVQRSYNPNAEAMAKLIQADLQRVGIRVTIENSLEWSLFLRRLTLGEHQAVLLGWSADHPDPDNFLSPLLSCASSMTGNNRTFWCNSEFDKIIQQSLETTNVLQRKAYYAQALQIVAEELPLLPIAHAKRFQARANNIEGQLLNAFGGIDFYKVSKH
ncbi:ABC transporter substrate-binding protein [Thalassotalea fusca]